MTDLQRLKSCLRELVTATTSNHQKVLLFVFASECVLSGDSCRSEPIKKTFLMIFSNHQERFDKSLGSFFTTLRMGIFGLCPYPLILR